MVLWFKSKGQKLELERDKLEKDLVNITQEIVHLEEQQKRMETNLVQKGTDAAEFLRLAGLKKGLDSNSQRIIALCNERDRKNKNITEISTQLASLGM